MEPWIPLVLGILGTLATAYGAQILVRKTKSGTVRTAEAETVFIQLGELKDEFKAERDYYREENRVLRSRIDQLEGRIAELERLLERRGGAGDRRT